MSQSNKNGEFRFIEEVVVGLTVSAVALSLGGAFGLLSGRGVLMGMLSAAIFPLITSIFGGTRIQCSGPTGPMTTIFIAIMLSASEHLQGVQQELLPAFLNMTIFLAAVLLILAGVIRLGNWVSIVPNVVISGFMDGIALIIWISQLKKLLQIGSTVIGGSLLINCILALSTIFVSCLVSRWAKSFSSRIAGLVSGTLIALIVMTTLSVLLDIPTDRASSMVSLHSWADIATLLSQNFPTEWPWHLLLLALPLALQLAGVAYFDTLLTALILDRKQNETSQRNRELGAQGIAMSCIAFIGGIPGAQATERSVLMLKEGAQSRLAGVFVGIFGLIGVFVLQDLVSMIPKAVFAGILLKVAYDVFDWQPLCLFVKQSRKKNSGNKNHITHMEIFIILFTASMTAFMNVTVSIIIGTAVFFLVKKYHNGELLDLQKEVETEGFIDEP